MQEDVARMDESARDQILWAALRLGGGRGATFAPQDVIDELRRSGTKLADSTIRTEVTSRMCANTPKNHGTVYADLERVGPGRYRLIDSHG
jgi:hypothetical protein